MQPHKLKRNYHHLQHNVTQRASMESCCSSFPCFHFHNFAYHLTVRTKVGLGLPALLVPRGAKLTLNLSKFTSATSHCHYIQLLQQCIKPNFGQSLQLLIHDYLWSFLLILFIKKIITKIIDSSQYYSVFKITPWYYSNKQMNLYPIRRKPLKIFEIPRKYSLTGHI